MNRLRPSKDDELRSHLAEFAHGSLDLRCAHRLHAVLLVSVGRSCYEVASWFGDNARTVERWVHAYEVQGVAGLRNHPGAGRPTRLTLTQRAQISIALAAEPSVCGFPHKYWSGKLLALHLQREYEVIFSQRHCQRLLQRLAH